MGEPSTSIVVRSEHQYAQQNDHRFAIRKHLYELLSTARPPSAAPQIFNCPDLLPDEQYGEYLGFVDLRLEAESSPVAMGVLAPPRRYRESLDTTIITGQYGPLFGGHGFPGTIYSMQDEAVSGARCAQACVIMALGLLSDRGARIMGSYTLTFLAMVPKRMQPLRPDGHTSCIRTAHASEFQGAFPINGLDVKETTDLLARPECRVSPFLNVLRAHSSVRLALRLVEAYVAARFPVILAVKTRDWWGPKYPTGSHAVVVVGFRQSMYDPDAVSWIVHDPGYKPFGERRAADCLRAALSYSSLNKVHLIAVAEEAIVTDPLWCVEFLNACDPYFQYLNRGPSIGRVISGMSRDPFESRTDFRIRLVRPEDIGCMFPATAASGIVNDTVEKATAHLAPRRHWCIGGYIAGDLCRLWLFEAEAFKSKTDAIVVCLDQGIPTFHQWRRRYQTPGAPDELKAEDDGARIPAPGVANAEVRRWEKRLTCSVMTSSSSRYLPDLFAELREMSRDGMAFDVFLLRREDLDHLRMEGVLDAGTAADALSERRNIPIVTDWLVRHLKAFPGITVPALATYFPQITSLNDGPRGKAIDAIAGSVIIAQSLKREGLMAHPIVEIVCGSQTDRCDCESCKLERGRDRGAAGAPFCDMYVSSVRQKTAMLLESLRGVCNAVEEAGGAKEFYLAVEIEPGSTYVLNGLKPLEDFEDEVRDDPTLNAHIGINLDIAHFRIAEEDAVRIRPSLVSRVLHAHISDHPFMHTRDQPVGKWTSVECGLTGGYRPYLQLLARRLNGDAGMASATDMPFSGAVALELEGCNRISWLRNSLGAMAHLFRTLQV